MVLAFARSNPPIWAGGGCIRDRIGVTETHSIFHFRSRAISARFAT